MANSDFKRLNRKKKPQTISGLKMTIREGYVSDVESALSMQEALDSVFLPRPPTPKHPHVLPIKNGSKFKILRGPGRTYEKFLLISTREP